MQGKYGQKKCPASNGLWVLRIGEICTSCYLSSPVPYIFPSSLSILLLSLLRVNNITIGRPFHHPFEQLVRRVSRYHWVRSVWIGYVQYAVGGGEETKIFGELWYPTNPLTLLPFGISLYLGDGPAVLHSRTIS